MEIFAVLGLCVLIGGTVAGWVVEENDKDSF